MFASSIDENRKKHLVTWGAEGGTAGFQSEHHSLGCFYFPRFSNCRCEGTDVGDPLACQGTYHLNAGVGRDSRSLRSALWTHLSKPECFWTMTVGFCLHLSGNRSFPPNRVIPSAPDLSFSPGNWFQPAQRAFLTAPRDNTQELCLCGSVMVSGWTGFANWTVFISKMYLHYEEGRHHSL